MALLLTAMITGLGGAFTPCTLGVNLMMIQFLSGKSKGRRLWEWTQFAVSRALLLTLLGLAIGLLGQAIESFTWWFQMVINITVVGMGVLFIMSRKKPVFKGFDFSGDRVPSSNASAAGLGMLFGLNITACIAPLVLALLAGTVLVGDWVLGAAALFIFGVMLSVPILVAIFSESASMWIANASRKYRTAFYTVIGAVLIVLGLAEIALSMFVIPGRT